MAYGKLFQTLDVRPLSVAMKHFRMQSRLVVIEL